MAGDHRCPVCQATFTRPQHVARHMRSHTGDRPYKCQYCGDQFARSDLLARHVNKCHANEKPPPNSSAAAAASRRKGPSAASRATTSKQACDQCVQSSLPCDGSNPCAKCIARRCRCTYVKFHRQTAPTGPGHHPPRSPSSPSSSSSSLNSIIIGHSRLPSHLDNFILAPPSSAPPVVSPPFMPSDQIFNTPFTFNPAAPPYPLNWTGVDMSQLPFAVASDPDMTAKYRAQADLVRRPGLDPMLPNSSPLMPYATQHPPLSSNWYPAWGESATYPPLDDTKPFGAIARSHSLTSSEPSTFAPDSFAPPFIGSAYRPRRVSLDFSDSSSSQSVPSSAASSSVHLPLTVNELCEEASDDAHGLQPQRSHSLPTPQPSFPDTSQPCHSLPLQQQPHRTEGGFSSAFGLMSIDDPNVLAGLSSDGMPFFSNLDMGVLPQSPNATPMPTRVHHPHPHQGRDRVLSLGALPTPGLAKDAADTRELREMWKTYLRSPLGGSGTTALDASTSLAHMPQSPSGQRRRMRVSSLPSVTPTVEKGHPLMMNGAAHPEGASAVRPTVHGNPEDLRCYEAAVNARSASLKLNLVPRRKRTRPTLSGSPPPSSASAASGQTDQDISRPSSSSSTSSLAQAFGLPVAHASSHVHGPVSGGVVKSPPMQGASISLPSMSMTGLHPSAHGHGHAHLHGYGGGHVHPPHTVVVGLGSSLPFEPGSRASSVTSDGTGTGTGANGSEGEAFRPSFKRYPSQTLVPATSKRVLVERGGGGGGGESKGVGVDQARLTEEASDGGSGSSRRRRRRGEETAAAEGKRTTVVRGGGGGGVGSPGSRPIAALPERAKRG